MAFTPALLAVAISVLGDDLQGHDADVLADVLMSDHVGGPSYSEETFRGHLEAIDEKGEGYLQFLQGIKSQPAMKAMYGFIITQGSEGVYGLLQQMGQAGLIDKKKVASAAKITQKAAPPRAYFRQIWDELATFGYEQMSEKFEASLDEYRTRFPEIDGETITGLDDLLWACGRSTLNAGVTKMTVSQTGKETSVALGWRIDAHSPKRNGGWDPKANDGAGDYTQDWHDAQTKKAEKAEAAEAEMADHIAGTSK